MENQSITKGLRKKNKDYKRALRIGHVDAQGEKLMSSKTNSSNYLKFSLMNCNWFHEDLLHSLNYLHRKTIEKDTVNGKITKRNILAIKKVSVLVFCMILTIFVFSQTKEKDAIVQEWDKMHQSKGKALKEFNESKFGMFIHWGVYSLPAGIWKGEKIKGLGEWIMYHAQIPREEYKNLCMSFNPVKFNAEEWVKAAKMAGMKYIVAMPKHHDGFAMYDSKVTDYDIVDITPFGRDPITELYQACQKYGIRFSIYYSHSIDWMDGGDAGYAQKKKENPEHSDNYGANLWDPSSASYEKYIEKKAKPQMKELLHKFPGMQEIWYDFPRFMNREQSFDFYKLAYGIQPSCLVNSRVGNNFGDFVVSGDNQILDNEKSKNIIWEAPGTLNNTWGYKSYDTDWKSTKELLYWITEITSKGGNYLLNVGPTAKGVFPEESLKQLKAIGEWMNINGESVYGTKRWLVNHEGPTNLLMKGTDNRENQGFNTNFTAEDFWFSSKDNYLYVTSLKWPDNQKAFIKSLSLLPKDEMNGLKSVQLLGCSEKISWKIENYKIEVLLPSKRPNSNGYVLKLTFEK